MPPWVILLFSCWFYFMICLDGVVYSYSIQEFLELSICASGPRTCPIVFWPIVARLALFICGHSSKISLMVSSTWQWLHLDGSPFGFSIRWQCVSLVCLILSLAIITVLGFFPWINFVFDVLQLVGHWFNVAEILPSPYGSPHIEMGQVEFCRALL